MINYNTFKDMIYNFIVSGLLAHISAKYKDVFDIEFGYIDVNYPKRILIIDLKVFNKGNSNTDLPLEKVLSTRKDLRDVIHRYLDNIGLGDERDYHSITILYTYYNSLQIFADLDRAENLLGVKL